MKLWPFNKQETRETSYTDALVTLLQEQATGEVLAANTAAVEGAVGLWARAFASARPMHSESLESVLNPAVLYSIGRDLCETGRWIGEIRVGPAGLLLERADSYVVTGLEGPETWEYELSFNRPSGQLTRTLQAGRVVDVRLGTGLSYRAPVAGAATTKALLNVLEAKLVQEVGTSVDSSWVCLLEEKTISLAACPSNL